MLPIALIAGVICAAIVAAYFIAIDQFRAAAATNGAFVAQPQRRSAARQLETLLRPVAARLPAPTAGRLRQQLSRAGDPGGLTPAGFQAVRYSLAALLAIVGLALGLILPLQFPNIVVAPLAGAVAALLG